MTLSADAAATLQPGFVGTHVPGWLEEAYAEGLISICLYGANVDDDGGLAPVCRQLRERLPDILLAVDEEGGDVTRIHYPAGSPAVGNAVLGRLDDLAVTRRSAEAIGHDLARLGIGLNLGPVVDVNSSPDNPVIGVRSFGAEAGLAGRHAAAWIEGLQETGVAACAKHLPGHGDTVADSHHALPRVDASLEVLCARELVPFEAAVRAGVAAVMTSHILMSAIDADRPATFSPKVMHVLRGTLGFDGVIISDALDMAGASADIGVPEAAVRALIAGVDLLCLGSNTTGLQYQEVHAAIVQAVGSGRLPRERLAEAAFKTRQLAHRFRPVPGPRPTVHTLPPAEVARAFQVTSQGRAFISDSAPLSIVQVHTDTNLAVGEVAWGPAAVGVAHAEADVLPGDRVAVVARAIGGGHPARQVADRLRAAGHRVALVDVGWPRSDVDIATYGASTTVASALVAVLRGEISP